MSVRQPVLLSILACVQSQTFFASSFVPRTGAQIFQAPLPLFSPLPPSAAPFPSFSFQPQDDATTSTSWASPTFFAQMSPPPPPPPPPPPLPVPSFVNNANENNNQQNHNQQNHNPVPSFVSSNANQNQNQNQKMNIHPPNPKNSPRPPTHKPPPLKQQPPAPTNKPPTFQIYKLSPGFENANSNKVNNAPTHQVYKQAPGFDKPRENTVTNTPVRKGFFAPQQPSPTPRPLPPPRPVGALANAKGAIAGKFLSQVMGAAKTENSDEDDDDKKKKKSKSVPSVGDTGYLFEPSQLRRINLIISPPDLAAITANPTAEQWVPCSIEIDYGTSAVSHYDGCGCRYKGSVGSLRMCVDRRTGLQNEQCRKLSWKLDANKFIPELPALPGVPSSPPDAQLFKGEKQLAVGGLPVDLSLLTERLAAGLMANIGMLAARNSHVKLSVNQADDGLYSLMEVPDDIFTRTRWGWDLNSGMGGLYKDALFRESSNSSYFRSKRVSGENDDKFMVEVTRAILGATDDTKRQAVLDTYFDTQSFVDITAFNSILGNTDDWRQRHNFFWYVLETCRTNPQPVTEADKKKVKKSNKVKKLVMIPWDYDRLNDENAKSRGQEAGAPPNWYSPIDLRGSVCNKVSASPHAEASHFDRSEYSFWVSVFEELPPDVGKPINCDEFTQVFALLARRVNERVVELANGALSDANVRAKMDEYSRQIDSSVTVNSEDPPNRQEWMAAKQDLQKYLQEARATALADAMKALGTSGAGKRVTNAKDWTESASISFAREIPSPVLPSFVPFIPKFAMGGRM